MTLRMAGLPAACVQSFDVPKGLPLQDAGPPAASSFSVVISSLS